MVVLVRHFPAVLFLSKGALALHSRTLVRSETVKQSHPPGAYSVPSAIGTYSIVRRVDPAGCSTLLQAKQGTT
jgi:hypothetical protein